MAAFDDLTTEHVLAAMAEHDALGAAAFLGTYGLTPTRDFVVRHEERSYDARAVTAVAQRHADGGVAGGSTAASKDGAVRALRRLGFEVLGFTTATSVGHEHARAAWALAARERLVETAGRYHAVVTAAELADFVQQRTLIKTGQPAQAWLGDVLARVSLRCAELREPLLASLCVGAHGRVLPVYAATVEEHRSEEVGDADGHAAHERLECYRRFGAVLPPGGGVPASTVRTAASRTAGSRTTAPRTATARQRTGGAPAAPAARTTATRPAPVDKPLALCPVHFTELPATGVCDLCD